MSVQVKIRFREPAIVGEYRQELESHRFEAVAPEWRLKLRAARDVIEARLNRLYCSLFDHEYDTNGADYPESGGEGFTCNRCGHSFTAWH